MINFMNAISKSPLAEFKNYISEIARPALEIIRVPEKKISLGSSRLGGNPDLPKEFAWPLFELDKRNAEIYGAKKTPL